MKKLLFLFYAIFLFSCSSDSDDNTKTNSSNSDYHPPAWIQGSWKGDVTYHFKQNNICHDQICFKEFIDGCNIAVPNSSFASEPIITETEYKFTYTTQNIVHEYHFVKVSSKEIKLINPNQGEPNFIYTKQ